jgi:hypothetical protein
VTQYSVGVIYLIMSFVIRLRNRELARRTRSGAPGVEGLPPVISDHLRIDGVELTDSDNNNNEENNGNID